MNDRTQTAWGELARLGFGDATRALQMSESIRARHAGVAAKLFLDVVAGAGDPDLCLQGISLIDESAPDLVGQILADEGWATRCLAVLGGSRALNEYLRAHPDDATVLAPPSSRWSAEQIRGSFDRAMASVDDGRAGYVLRAADEIRRENKRQLIRIAARDLIHSHPQEIVDDICAELSDLADAVMASVLEIARARTPLAERVRLAIIALGKCGAREVNYLSDIDVLYLAEPADAEVGHDETIRIATRIASGVARICSAHSMAGTIWQVDAALRPDGKSGPLVRSLASHRSYYQKWAKNWELQAMLKARPMAGDAELGQAFCDMVAPLVWQVGGQANFMSEIQAMRQRVVSLIPVKEREREIKLGAGGLRDVEFTVQLLQLVHGRVDDRLRQAATLPALAALVDHGYIGRSDGARLGQAYRFQRVLEHREQLFRLRRTHLMPDQPAELSRLARQVGAASGDALWKDWRVLTKQVRRLQQRVFYSPLLEAVSRLSGEDIRLSPEAASDRLRALGFSDPQAALRHIEALTTGLSRTTEIQRQLIPAMLEWFSQGPNPDLGLLEFRRLSEAMGSTSWYMRALRDEGWMAERLARLLSASRYISGILRKDPSVVQLLAEEGARQPRGREDLEDSMRRVIDRHEGNPQQALSALCSLRRRELFRLASIDVLSSDELAAQGQGLSDLAGATIQAGLQLACAEVSSVGGVEPPPLAVIAMGRWGGREMGYSSDADALFVIPDDCTPEQLAAAEKVVTTMRRLIGPAGGEPALNVDADLRPDGRSGALVRTLGSYLAYYQQWSATWESQALLRASFGAGDRRLAERFLTGIAFRRYPETGIDAKQIAEIRRLKARMEKERTSRRTASLNLKLGRGGLSDVEWTIQMIQLRHAHAHPSLQVTSTRPAIHAAQAAGLVTPGDASVLLEAWEMASQLRNSTMLVRGRAGDLLPSDPRETASVAMLLGYQHAQASQLIEAWSRTARHASSVVDRLFWGLA